VDNTAKKAVSVSALPAIARHEKTLIESERESRAEAKQIVDKARAEAFGILDESARATTAEVAAIRREGEESRERERQNHLAEFDRKLREMREDAKTRAGVAIGAVVALVLPKGVH
jgi:vacuolar-type H+-ATPase subunit H